MLVYQRAIIGFKETTVLTQLNSYYRHKSTKTQPGTRDVQIVGVGNEDWNHQTLVGGFNSILKNDGLRQWVPDDNPYMKWKIIQPCLKPPTRTWNADGNHQNSAVPGLISGQIGQISNIPGTRKGENTANTSNSAIRPLQELRPDFWMMLHCVLFTVTLR